LKILYDGGDYILKCYECRIVESLLVCS